MSELTPVANFKVLAIGIALIQLFDIIVHASTGQLEIIRVTSNIVILLWLAVLLSGRFTTKFLLTAINFLGLYILLNIIFLVREGLTNEQQGGSLRIALFILVFLTLVFSTVLIYIQDGRPSKSRK